MRSNNLCNSIGGSEKGKAMDANSFKKRLNDGELLLGTHLTAPNPKLAALCCQANIDFLWIDTEHDPYASESLGLVPVLARQSGVAPVVRVGDFVHFHRSTQPSLVGLVKCFAVWAKK